MIAVFLHAHTEARADILDQCLAYFYGEPVGRIFLDIKVSIALKQFYAQRFVIGDGERTAAVQLNKNIRCYLDSQMFARSGFEKPYALRLGNMP